MTADEAQEKMSFPEATQRLNKVADMYLDGVITFEELREATRKIVVDTKRDE
jgi:hypothetical protein